MSDEHGEFESGASRRAWLAGAGAIGATAVLAACGSETEGPSTPPGNQANSPDPGPAETGGEGSGDDGDETGGDQEVLTNADEVEVGSGVILASESVVVTQPTAGTFMGFSAACTHEGCTVSSIRDGIIHCACHGSQYSIEDGSVLQGPATRPLPAVEIQEDGGSIVRA